MATKQELINALRKAHKAGDAEAVNAIANHLDAGDYDEDKSFQGQIKSAADNDPIIGAAENVLSFATGAIAEPIAGLSGIAASIFGGKQGAGAKTVEDVQKALTYAPRTASGQEIQQGVGKTLAPVGEAIGATEDFLGEGTLSLTGSPVLAAGAATLPTAALELAGLKGIRKARPSVEDAAQTPPISDGGFTGTDIPATRGEQLQANRSGDAFDQLKEEQFLLEQSGQAGDELRSFKAIQSEEVNRYLSDIAPENAGEVGQSVKDAIELRNNSSRFKRSQAYDKLAEVTKDTNVGLNTDIIGEVLPEAGELRDFAATQPGQFKAVSDLLTEFGIDKTNASIGRMESQGIPITPLSVENAERFRKRLNAIEQADNTGSTSRITGPIKTQLDSEFDIAAKALEANGSEDIARAAKNARNSHIALKTEFDEKGIVDRLTANASRGSKVPKIEESQVYSKIIANSTPIEQFDSLITSLDRAGSKGKLAKNSIKSRMILDLIDSGFAAGSRKIKGERVFGGNAFSKRFAQIEPKLKSLMSESEFARLSKIKEISKDLTPPSGAIPKGSAGLFIDTMNKLGVFVLLDKIPGAGPILAEQTKLLGRRSKDAKSVRKALSNPKTKEAFDLIKSDYPALAVALGVGQIKSDNEKESK